jgi:hypothetical protein
MKLPAGYLTVTGKSYAKTASIYADIREDVEAEQLA